jgi:hypothetical protein
MLDILVTGIEAKQVFSSTSNILNLLERQSKY